MENAARQRGAQSAIALDDPLALGRLGVLHAQQGKLRSAERLLREALDRGPGIAELHNNLGMTLYAQRRVEEAIASYKAAVAIRPGYAVALNNLGVALAALGRHEAAIVSYKDALRADFRYAEAFNNLGTLLHAIGRSAEAAERFRRAISLRPGFIEAIANLGHALAKLGRPGEAIPCYQKALKAQPGNALLQLSLAGVLREASRHGEATASYEAVVATQPDLALAHAGLGTTLLELGKIDAARQCFETAISLEPDRPSHFLGLSRTTTFSPGHRFLGKLMALTDNLSGLSDDEQVDAHFAIGKALADVGENQRSFEHFVTGNRLKRQSLAYDEAAVLGQLRKIGAAFSPERLQLLQGCGDPSSLPGFIVGMPRSGSTLVEQILTSHGQVFGAGEVGDYRDSLRAGGFYTRICPFPESAAEWTHEHVQAGAKAYLRRLTTRIGAGKASVAVHRVTDKMLSNFRYVGLIHLMFPNARIIHTRRDPLDTCLSCFSIQFAKLPFTFDLAELGRYYREYARLMDHWRTLLPSERILEIRYEDLVRDFETGARRILAYCGLDWDDACLRFHEAERPVRTASLAQVRQPLYQHAVGRWRPDLSALQPLLQALNAK